MAGVYTFADDGYSAFRPWLGEFLVRGPLVMKGYRREPGKTAEAVEDGWLHASDVMTMDGHGYLTIVDRKKELITNASGKNMSPANIENVMKAACPLIGGIAAIGDRRPQSRASGASEIAIPVFTCQGTAPPRSARRRPAASAARRRGPRTRSARR
jgi:acyl-CoA synthetase (AMP-forming)/AMP-acid ligase II